MTDFAFLQSQNPDVVNLVNLDTREVFYKEERFADYFINIDRVPTFYNSKRMLHFWSVFPKELVQKCLEHLTISLYYAGSLKTLTRYLLGFPWLSAIFIDKILPNENNNYVDDIFFKRWWISPFKKLVNLFRIVDTTVAIYTDTYNGPEKINPAHFEFTENILPQIEIQGDCFRNSARIPSNPVKHSIFTDQLQFVGVLPEEITDSATRTFRCLNSNVFDSHLLYHYPIDPEEVAIYKCTKHLTPVFCFSYTLHGEQYSTLSPTFSDHAIEYGIAYEQYERVATMEDLDINQWKTLAEVFQDIYGPQCGLIVNDNIRIE